mgnify:CR=1 FL=1
MDPFHRHLCRLIRSEYAGVGKTLQKDTLVKNWRQTHQLEGEDVTIPIHKHVNGDDIIASLKSRGNELFGSGLCDSIHIDIAFEVYDKS